MSKYDFAVDLTDNTSTGLLLHKVSVGASVLEFGCAEGRMTRYMAEKLKCSVTIVEYEQEAFEKAKRYAVDGLCDDIMHFAWLERFADRRFDFIIFADVLEHLCAPGEVLKKAEKILAPNGKVLISLPNATHNDILLKAVQDRIDYTSVGLLDDTHIHFWGRENLAELAQQGGLLVQKVEATYCPTGMTEQKTAGGQQEGNRLLENLLRCRTCGEIYQFVITLGREAGTEHKQLLRVPGIDLHIYLDFGDGFQADNCFLVRAQKLEQDVFLLHYVLKDVEHLQQIRLDPVEEQGCLIRKALFTQGGIELQKQWSDSVFLGESVLMCGTDPGITVSLRNQTEAVVMDVEVLLPGVSYLCWVQKELEDVCRHRLPQMEIKCAELTAQYGHLLTQKTNLDQAVQCKDEQIANLEDANNALSNSNEQLRIQLQERDAQMQELDCQRREQIQELTKRSRQQLQAQKAENEKNQEELEAAIVAHTKREQELQEDVNAYALLAFKKDQCLLQKDQHLMQMETELRRLQGFVGVRLHNFCGRCYRKMRRIAGAVLRKLGLRR